VWSKREEKNKKTYKFFPTNFYYCFLHHSTLEYKPLQWIKSTFSTLGSKNLIIIDFGNFINAWNYTQLIKLLLISHTLDMAMCSFIIFGHKTYVYPIQFKLF
jgi:hypothetical protein